MGFLDKVHVGKRAVPRRTVLYAVHGIGKSTWAAQWPKPIFIPTEDGLADIDCASFPLCETLTEAWTAVMELATEEHGFETVVLDSVDWLEQLIWMQICEKKNVEAITEIDFGKGYGEASVIFRRVLNAFEQCRARGMNVIFLAHAKESKVEPPGEASYTRYEPKLHKGASEMMQEWCDELLFANYRVDVRSEDQGFNKSRGIAMGKGERVVFTQERAAHLAKNRLGLPAEMPLDFSAYQPFLKGAIGANGN